MIKRRTDTIIQNDLLRVARGIYRRIKWRKHNKRPCEIQYQVLAYQYTLSYKKIRNIVDQLVDYGALIKYHGRFLYTEKGIRKRCFYLWAYEDWAVDKWLKTVDKSVDNSVDNSA